MNNKFDLNQAYSLKTPEDSIRHYQNTARIYDTGFAEEMDYILPFHVFNIFHTNFNSAGPILDVGAGTGLVGALLKDSLSNNVDGIDISQDMLNVAQEKKIYDKAILADLTRPLYFNSNIYDGIVSAGTFTLGHVGPEALDELLRIGRSGCLFVISINTQHFESDGFLTKFQSLENKITNYEEKIVNNYGPKSKSEHKDDTGTVVTFLKR